VEVKVGYYDTYLSVQLINTTFQSTKQQSNKICTYTLVYLLYSNSNPYNTQCNPSVAHIVSAAY